MTMDSILPTLEDNMLEVNLISITFVNITWWSLLTSKKIQASKCIIQNFKFELAVDTFTHNI
jgi:hypothetical protein